ncbi:hypothetical protein A2U01_0101448, partial [Trifolium medium]|nr:hypothetical protein [Trifolium medium]
MRSEKSKPRGELGQEKEGGDHGRGSLEHEDSSSNR